MHPPASGMPEAAPGGVPPAPGRPPPRGPNVPSKGKTRGPTTALVVLAMMAGVGLGATCATCATLADDGGEQLFFSGRDKVGVVELLGEIKDSSEVVRNIREFAERDDLVALVLRIDSPGGAVAPSQEIYEALRHAAKSKPVVASMGAVAASGGFWASLGADWVFASPGSITGSIGVITQTPDLRGVAELLRVKFRTFKSGPLKDAGNPFREMTPEDAALFQSLIDDIYDQFVSLTAERRQLPLEAVKTLADGRVMTGRAAKEAGLVDALGGLHESAQKALQMAKNRKAEETGKVSTATTASDSDQEPVLVYPRKKRPPLLELLMESTSRAIATGMSEGVEGWLGRETAPVELR